MSGSTGGLEDVGIPGQGFLRNALTSCTDPLKAIESFQVCIYFTRVSINYRRKLISIYQMDNGILLPSLRPMLPLLDLHDVRRLDFHNSVLEVRIQK